MRNFSTQQALLESLEIGTAEIARLLTKKATLGFDGCIDSVVKVVKQRDERGESFFESSEDFAHYILEKGSKNFSIELTEITSKIGGNMPIMAMALSSLGPSVDCIGAMGYPRIHKVFSGLPSNCTLHSFANPGSCIAFEFRENKMMTAEMQELSSLSWEAIETLMGRDSIVSLFSDCDLVGILNWSEIESSTDVWKGLLANILPQTRHTNGRPIGFFDLSDCSKRPRKKIHEAIGLLQAFNQYYKVILSMNHNEAVQVFSVLKDEKLPLESPLNERLKHVGEEIFSLTGLDKVVIHHATGAFCWDAGGFYYAASRFIEDPAILTGAGDNFNAGFCAGLLMNLPVDKSLALGHAVSGHYLRTRTSPTLEQLGASVLVK